MARQDHAVPPRLVAALLQVPAAAASRWGRGALCVLGGMYAHSPLRGGRREESSVVEHSPRPVRRSVRRSGRPATPTPEPHAAVEGTDTPARGVRVRSVGFAEAEGSQDARGANGASLQARIQMTCAVESPHFFGVGRMKKWRGSCSDGDDLLTQLAEHFKLAEQDGLSNGGGAGHTQILLQFFDKELEEYIDLEASSWDEFKLQVLFTSVNFLPVLQISCHP